MPWLCTTVVVLLLIVLISGCRGYCIRDSPSDRHAGTALQVLSTALGVFAALYFSSVANEQTTTDQLEKWTAAAIAEAKASLQVVKNIDKADSGLADSERLILEAPARVLSALVSYPLFLERVPSERSAELAALSTRLGWQIDLYPLDSGAKTYGHAYGILSADPRRVEKDLDQAINLLEQQMKEW